MSLDDAFLIGDELNPEEREKEDDGSSLESSRDLDPVTTRCPEKQRRGREREEVVDEYMTSQSYVKGGVAKEPLAREVTFDPITEESFKTMSWSSVLKMPRHEWNKFLLSQAHGEDPATRLKLREDWEFRSRQIQVVTDPVIQKAHRWSALPAGFFVPAKGAAYAYCGLFAVYKTIEPPPATLRLIMNARPANECFEKNPTGTLKFFGLDELMDALDEFIWHPEAVFLHGDERHFYYQVPFSEFYARFLTVFGPDKLRYLPTVLAMGFFPAVEWGQSITMTVVLHAEEGEVLLGVAEEDLENGMPSLIWLYEGRRKTTAGASPSAPKGRRVGFIAVLIDGFLLVTLSSTLRDLWGARLARNFQQANLVLKRSKTGAVSPTAVSPRRRAPRSVKSRQEKWASHGLYCEDEGATFCGLNIQKEKGWTPESTLLPLPKHPRAPRRIWAAHLGKILWRLRCFRLPLLWEESLMELYTFIGTQDCEWDEEVTLDDDQISVLREQHDRLAGHPPQPKPAARKTPEGWLYVASDATPTAVAFIIFKKEDGRLIPVAECARIGLPKREQVVREAQAAAAGICAARALANYHWPGKHFGVVCAVDAEAVRIPFTKRYSPSAEIRRCLRAVFTVENWEHTVVRMVRVPGLENIADVPSRGLYAYQ